MKFEQIFEEEKEIMQKEKYQLLTEHNAVKEEVTKSLHFVPGLAQMKEETTESQVGKLTEAIQQLQERVVKLEMQEVPMNLQEVRDQRKETTRSTVERIKELALECNQLSN